MFLLGTIERSFLILWQFLKLYFLVFGVISLPWSVILFNEAIRWVGRGIWSWDFTATQNGYIFAQNSITFEIYISLIWLDSNVKA